MLGGPRSHARGYLESIWESAYESGEPIIGDTATVEAVAEYPGEPGSLVKALVGCGGDRPGFLETVPGREGVWRVHDLFDHAPDYVRKRWSRERTRKHRYAPRQRKLTAEWRSDLGGLNNDLGGLNPNKAELGCPPAPTPKEEEIHPTGSAAAPPAAEEETSPVNGPANQNPATARARKAKAPTGPHAEFVRVFCDAWTERYGDIYPFAGGKDGKHVKWVRDQLADDLSRWRGIVEAYLGDDDPFYAGHPLGMLVSQFAKFKVPRPPPRKTGRAPPNMAENPLYDGIREFINRGETNGDARGNGPHSGDPDSGQRDTLPAIG